MGETPVIQWRVVRGARLKADDAVRLFKEGRTVTEVSEILGIGRGASTARCKMHLLSSFRTEKVSLEFLHLSFLQAKGPESQSLWGIP
jgi:uncharacterized protein